MARGFVLGATAGRTTLNGEGLQHEDGHSPLLASTNPGVVAYDPAFGFEVGHIVRDGLRRMYGDDAGERLLLPDDLQRAVRAAGRARRASTSTGCCAGCTCTPPARRRRRGRGRSCSRPASPCRGRCARRSCCADDWGVHADVWSVTSLERAAPRRPRRATGTTCSHPGERAADGVRHRSGSPAAPARSSRCRTTCARCRTRSGRGCRATTLAGHRRVGHVRHPGRAAPALPGRRRGITVRTLAALARRGEVDRPGRPRGDREVPAP